MTMTMTYESALALAATSQSIEADVADAMIARDCAEIDALDTHDVVAGEEAGSKLTKAQEEALIPLKA
jgi:NAD-dependent DNA ligase